MTRLAALATLALSLLTAGCSDASTRRVRVFAASSLTAPFEELADAFERARPGVKVDLHCTGTPRLVLQLREGASADVFASADGAQMQRVVDVGQTRSAPSTFASNTMAIVTRAGNPLGIAGLEDLEEPKVSVLLCSPDVPAGRYARQALERAGVEVRSRSDEPSVRAVVSKVRLGVADAGIVYRTDTRSGTAGIDVVNVTIPAQHNVQAHYPIAPLTTGEQPALGDAFVAFVLGPEGQAILSSHGFGKP